MDEEKSWGGGWYRRDRAGMDEEDRWKDGIEERGRDG